ncbi:MFS transporter [Candidatus Paracaedibacter symbiosus]|uniref:MFS transporter n=1 Tax=Candidatus Paracaedibacter symbiosus TaxID=244582 RepID=UPI0006904D9E|nr:MFS transporter [Candidatus Paracaedibacter symbiosus]
MRVFSSLKRSQKEAVGLLQIGTFLEYFDLMLYVHMAILLNELFFPKTDPHTASLLAAFAFCSTYVLRPFGALLFGYIGDHIGRKPTVIITTMMMSISCVIMANLPTYAQIGIAAAWLVTGCRIMQGLSSMGEIMGAEIYVTEITKPPAQYPAVALIGIASYIGAVAALGIVSLVTHFGFNWRIAFWIGAGIAVIGSMARTRLRETSEFLTKRRKLTKRLEDEGGNTKGSPSKVILTQKLINEEKIGRKTFWAYFIVYCGWPLSFYLAYMYFNQPLKEVYGYTSEEVIFHNFLLSIISLVIISLLCAISCKTHPLKILEIRGKMSLFLSLLLPIAIMKSSNHFHIFLIQTLILLTALSPIPGVSVFIKYLPTLKRFTAASFVYALSRAIMYLITSFSLVYLTKFLGYYGLWLILIPVNIGFLWGVRHFEELEKDIILESKRRSKIKPSPKVSQGS